MGVASLLQFLRRYAAGALCDLPGGGDAAGDGGRGDHEGVPPFDVVYVDANSVLNDDGTGDAARLL
eukprot:gene5764-8698_t